MSAESIVKDALASVPKAVAAGVVDMGSGLLLAVKTAESHPQEVLDVLAPATRELFEGDMTTSIENMFKQARGVESNDRYFQEIMIASTNLWHYFGRLKSSQETVVTVVTTVDVNLGMFIVKARAVCAAGTI